MSKYLNPRNDLAFKLVFGRHKHLCISLINSMLPLENPVVSIEYQSGELIPDLPGDLKLSVVDVRCTDSAGRQFIVEMQFNWRTNYQKRTLLNAAKSYAMQLNVAEDFSLLQPVYMISFVNEIFETSLDMSDEYYHYYKIINIKNTNKQIKGLEFLFIELPKFKPQNRAEKKLFELWLRFLTEINEKTEDVPPELLEDELIKEAIHCMERAAFTKEQLAAYDQRKINLLASKSDLEEERIKGKAEGLAEGEAKGEKNTKIAIAQKMLSKGIDIAEITDMTGLSTDEIKAL